MQDEVKNLLRTMACGIESLNTALKIECISQESFSLHVHTLKRNCKQSDYVIRDSNIFFMEKIFLFDRHQVDKQHSSHKVDLASRIYTTSKTYEAINCLL